MPRPVAVSSDTLSSPTLPSFVDNGRNPTHCKPLGGDPTAITAWIEGTIAPPVLPPASVVSKSIASIDSCFDDSADMRNSSPFETVPGFGLADHGFYSKGKPKMNKYEEEWTVEKEKALAGDMLRSLTRLKRVSRVEIGDVQDVERRKARKERNEEEIGALEDDGRVRIMKPLKWGTFVIKGNDGRVVIVDEHGEYDSGKVHEREELEKREREHSDRIKREKKRDKARREAEKRAEEEIRRMRRLEKQEERKKRRAESKGEERDRHHYRRGHRPYLAKLTSIPEDGTPEENVSGMISPTKLFTTGTQDRETPSMFSITRSSALSISPRRPSSFEWPTSQRSFTNSTLSERSLISASARSTVTSTTDSDDSQTRQHSLIQESSAIGLPSSIASSKYSDATLSTMSALSQHFRAREGAVSLTKNSTFIRKKSVESWKDNANDHSTRDSTKRFSSMSSARVASITSWRAELRENSVASSEEGGMPQDRFRPSLTGDLYPEPDQKPASTSSRRSASRNHSEVSSHSSEHKTLRPSTHSRNASISAWLQDSSSDTTAFRGSLTTSTPSVRSHKSATSQASIVTPYSWRRQVEELSDHSTVGTVDSPPPMPSPIPSVDLGSDGEDRSKDNEDAVSVKSHSTYRAPTVEEVPDEEDGAHGCDAVWDAKNDLGDRNDEGQNTSEVDSPKWSGKTGWGGDAEPEELAVGDFEKNVSVKGSGVDSEIGEQKDRSGYEEDNETWLNAEVGGVKYREAEWRTDPPKGSWRDV